MSVKVGSGNSRTRHSLRDEIRLSTFSGLVQQRQRLDNDLSDGRIPRRLTVSTMLLLKFGVCERRCCVWWFFNHSPASSWSNQSICYESRPESQRWWNKNFPDILRRRCSAAINNGLKNLEHTAIQVPRIYSDTERSNGGRSYNHDRANK